MADDLVQIDIANIDLEKPPIIKTMVTKNFYLQAGDLGLTKEERAEYDGFQMSNLVLGPAAGSCLMCPGNQINTPLEARCPYYAKCPLRRMGKAPQDKLCPIELNIISERFGAWCRELEQEPDNLSESDRSFVADLTWIDLQVQRCVNILSTGEDARLMHTNVTEAMLLDPEDAPIPITYEKVFH